MKFIKLLALLGIAGAAWAGPSAPPAGNFIVNVSTIAAKPAINIDSATIKSKLTLPFATANQFLTVDGNGVVISSNIATSAADVFKASTQTFTGANTFTSSTTFNKQVKIQTTGAGQTQGGGGSILLVATNETGMPFQIYSSSANQAGFFGLINLINSNTSYANAYLYISGASSATGKASAYITDPNPNIQFVQTGVASPAGQYEFMVLSDTMQFRSMNSGGTAYKPRLGMGHPGQLLFYETNDNGHYVALKASATISSNVTWIMPPTDGSAGQVLQTDGAGNLSFGSSTVTGLPLPSGAANYIQNTSTLQSGAVLNVASGTIVSLQGNSLNLFANGGGHNTLLTSYKLNGVLTGFSGYDNITSEGLVMRDGNGVDLLNCRPDTAQCTVAHELAASSVTVIGSGTPSISVGGSGAGEIDASEGSVPPGIPNNTVSWADGTTHWPEFIPNNGSAYRYMGSSATVTVGDVAGYSAQGSLLDLGAPAVGTVSSAAQYQVAFYSAPGNSNVLTSSPNFTNNGTTVTITSIKTMTELNVTTKTISGVYWDLSASTSAMGATRLSGSYGTAGQAYTSNGPGAAPGWTTISGGGGTPGGSSGQIQYNSAGSFAGAANSVVTASSLTYNGPIQADTATLTTFLKIGGGGLRGSNPAADLARTVGVQGGHGWQDSSAITGNSTTGYNPFANFITLNGAGPYEHTVGFQSAPSYASTSTISYMYDFLSQTSFDNSGNASVHAGYVMGNPTINSTGRPSTEIGFYVPAELTAGSGSNFAFYTPAHQNYMQGLILGNADTYYTGSTLPMLMINAPNNADALIRLFEKDNNIWDIAAAGGTSRFDIRDQNATPYFSILTGGKTGIGTTSPGSTLEVNGDETIDSTFTVKTASISINGVANAYPAAACSSGQVLQSNGGSPQVWTCVTPSAGGGASGLQEIMVNNVRVTSPTVTEAFSSDFKGTATTASTATISLSSLNGAINTFSSSETITGAGGLGVTYGVNAATGVFTSTGTTNTLQIVANGTYGTTNGTSGGFLMDCTGGGALSGMCGQVYSNAGAQLNLDALWYLRANNTAWNEPLLYLSDAYTGAQSTIRIDSGWPTITYVDSSESAGSAKKFQDSVHHGTLRIEGRNAADNAFDSRVVISSDVSSGIVFVGGGYGTAVSTLDVAGNASIGASVAGATVAPANGLLVQGSILNQALTASLPVQTDSNKNLVSSAIDLSGTQATGTMAAGREPAHTGDVTNSAGSLAMTAAAVQGNITTFTSSITLQSGVMLSSGITVSNPSAVITTTSTLTSSMTVVTASCIATNTTNKWITLTLPKAASYPGLDMMIYDVGTDSCSIKVQAATSEVIEGTGTIRLDSKFQHASLHSLGSVGWGTGLGGIQTTPAALYQSPMAPTSVYSSVVSSDIVVCPLTVTQPVTVTGIRYCSDTSGTGTISFGILDQNGAVIQSTGPVTPSGTGTHTLNMNLTALAPGQYYMATQLTGSAMQINGSAVTDTTPLCSRFAETTQGIPSLTFPGTGTAIRIPYYAILVNGGRTSE